MARLTKELRDRCVAFLEGIEEHDVRLMPSSCPRCISAEELAACSVDYPDLANHPTTTELADGRVQITLSAEEWRAIREASR